MDISTNFTNFGAADSSHVDTTLATSIDLAREGNHDAFEILYNNYVKDIYRHVGRRVPEEHMSDIVSDIFLRVWNKLSSFKGNDPSQFRGWIFTISHNMIVDFYRKNKTTISLDETFEIADTKNYANPSQETEDVMFMEKVARTMQGLPQKYQEILTLKYFQDLPYEEIAIAMATTEGNARIMLHRALKILKEKIEEEENSTQE